MKLVTDNPTETLFPYRLNTLRINTIGEIVAVLKGLDIRMNEEAAARFPKDLLIDDRDPRAHIKTPEAPVAEAETTYVAPPAPKAKKKR